MTYNPYAYFALMYLHTVSSNIHISVYINVAIVPTYMQWPKLWLIDIAHVNYFAEVFREIRIGLNSVQQMMPKTTQIWRYKCSRLVQLYYFNDTTWGSAKGGYKWSASPVTEFNW